MRAAAAVLLSVLAAALGAGGAAASSGADAARADDAYAQLQSQFAVAPLLYRESSTAPDGSYSTAWPLSQALAAALSLARLPGGSAYRAQVGGLLAALNRYWDGSAYESLILPPYGGGGPVFYDDNEWIALDLLDAAAVLHKPGIAARAQLVFDLVTRGWDGDPGATCPGGVFWGRQSADRNAVSTENAALLGARLYQLTGRRSDLDWAITMDAWVSRCLRGPDALVRDHLRGDGSLDGTVWSYNQGATVATELLLYRFTRSRAYLAQARATTGAALAAGFEADPPEFVAIFFRDVDGTGLSTRAAMQAYADEAWEQRDPTSLIQSAALADLYARLAT